MCIHNNIIRNLIKWYVAMLLRNLTLATMEADKPYGLIEQGAVVIDGEAILWAGAETELPEAFRGYPGTDLEGRLVTPAFLDCHTHIVHGGNRAGEFEMLLEGVTYEEVARAGGGIVSTVKATREAGKAELLRSALPRVDALIAEGVSVIEMKSGYGLDRDTELAMLHTAKAIEASRPVRVRTSFLGAHAIPTEYKDRPEAYLDEVCLPALEAAHEEGLVDAVDGFCEGIAFSPDQIERLFEKARALGIRVKIHAEQLSNLGGAQLAARFDALSADHLEYASEADAQALAAANVVAVLLPGAFYNLRETQLPPLEAFRSHGVPLALATDCNPGSSPLTSLLLVMNMACTLFRMTPEEALAGVTRNAARALGLDDTGVIRAGLRADLAVWDVSHPAELAYRIGFNPLHARYFGGRS